MRHIGRKKAFVLRNEANQLLGAVRLINNTPFDIDPADERVLLCQAKLPGFRDQVFEGEALLNQDGSLISMGVRTSDCGCVREVILNSGVGRTAVQERTYCATEKTTWVVNALFTTDGQLLRYSEEVQGV